MNITEFVGGWLVGDFEPALVKTGTVEVALKHIKAGSAGDGHYHKKGSEYTVLINGKAIDQGKEYGVGDIIKIEAYRKNFTLFIEDSVVLSIKEGSGVDDKYY
jgi:uncharacterized protein YacL (UPF0231 family)